MAEPPQLPNELLAERLEAFAALLDLVGDRGYAARAYRRAAELIRATPAPVAELVRAGRAQELRGIGPGIEARLRELVETGAISELDELERETSPELVGLGRLVGLAPQRMVAVGQALGIRTAAELREAAEAGRLRDVAGIGPKTEARVLAALAAEGDDDGGHPGETNGRWRSHRNCPTTCSPSGSRPSRCCSTLPATAATRRVRTVARRS